MKEPEFDNGSAVKAQNSNRRAMLKAIGLAALSGTGASAFAMSAKTPGQAMVNRIYATVGEMKHDRQLKAGWLARTIGYHRPGDGGDAEYLISAVMPEREPGFILLENNLFARLINVSTVNYRMFGAAGDGKNDDGVQIKAAHTFANQNNVPVVNLSGEFWLKETNNVLIMTNVQWGHTVFHIDEKHNTISHNRFIISGREKAVSVDLDSTDRSAVLRQLVPGVTLIPELANYKNSLIVVTDDNDRIGVRSGSAYNGRVSKPREEFFLVEEHGRILGDIAWGFKDYTKIVAYPAEASYLLIEGGTFYLSGESSGPSSGSYYQMGITVNRSRTIIRNQWVGLEVGRPDLATSPRRGFYSFNYVYDVLLENVRLIPWEKNRPGTGNDVPQGTYGIGGSYALNATFRNVTAEGSPVHWGVFGTNLFKNFRVEQCVLNRIDVHFYCMNLYVRDSKIGTNGITITGGGDLFIENTVCHSNHFISFRRDYGGRWDGDIRLRNCKLAPSVSGETSVLSFAADNFDYKYPIWYGRTVKVHDMIIDFRSVPTSKSICRLMKLSSFSKTSSGERVFFPRHVEFRNVTVEGREQGVRMLELPDPQLLKLTSAGSYDKVQLRPNCRMIFEDIQLEDLSASDPGAHLLLEVKKGKAHADEYALYPEIKIARCDNIAADFGGNVAEVLFEHCKIAGINAGKQGPMPGLLEFTSCRFIPAVRLSAVFYNAATELGTSFINCMVFAPQTGQEMQPEILDLLGFIAINKTVRFNHVNTRLGNDIHRFLKDKGVSLDPNFVSMLKLHAEIE